MMRATVLVNETSTLMDLSIVLKILNEVTYRCYELTVAEIDMGSVDY